MHMFSLELALCGLTMVDVHPPEVYHDRSLFRIPRVTCCTLFHHTYYPPNYLTQHMCKIATLP